MKSSSQRALVIVLVIASAILNVNSTLFQSKIVRKISASVAAAICFTNPQLSLAEAGQNDIECTVILPKSASTIYGKGAESAIYLTAKQDVGIWTAQVRGQFPPPILTSRTAAPFDFPLAIMLNGQTDLTPEGLTLQSEWQRGKTPLVVSARLDVDGVAATRNAEDLIGKATVSKDKESGKWSGCSIELEDRGLGGRIVTKKQK
jgi:hypothetical protein